MAYFLFLIVVEQQFLIVVIIKWWENLQWLRKELNMWKGNRFILPLTIEEQDLLMKEMFPDSIKKNWILLKD